MKDVIRNGDLVKYHGSIATHHGLAIVDDGYGYTDGRAWSLRPLGSDRVMDGVRRESFTLVTPVKEMALRYVAFMSIADVYVGSGVRKDVDMGDEGY